jgi:hypothetical protein
VSDEPLPLPAFTSWPTFPFEGELRVKQLADPVEVEPPRHGEDPAECTACRAPDSAYIWVSERWRVRALDRPTGLPAVLILESRSHLDMGDLPNLLAAELGVLTVRLERAIRSLDGVARVHVNRWGDGSAHLHVWFLARPTGRLQLRGTFLSLWDDILPRIPETQWRENLALVAAWLADFGGTALAEPPHIDWQAPAQLNLPAAAEVEPEDEDVAASEPDTTVLAGDADPERSTGVVADTVALPTGVGSADGITTVAVPTQSPRGAERTEGAGKTVKLPTGSAQDAAKAAAGKAKVGKGNEAPAAPAEPNAAEAGQATAGSGAATAEEPATKDIGGKRAPAAGSETVWLGNRSTSSGSETINLTEVGSGATIRFPTTAAAAEATARFVATGGAASGAETMAFPSGDAMETAASAETAAESGSETVKLPATEDNDGGPQPDAQHKAGGDAIASGVKTRKR